MAHGGADEPPSESLDGDVQSPKDRSLLHQSLAIRELVDTEVSYLHMLQLCASDIRSRLQQLPQGDLAILFSNIDEIIQVNSKFLHGLQETASKEEEQVYLIASKYTKVEQLTLRERLARINTHTLSKKTNRLSQMLKQEAGLVPRTQDKDFDDLEERFQWVSLCVTELKNNVAAYLDNLEAFLRFRPHECDLDIPSGPAVQYCSLARDQHETFLEFKRRLEGLVWCPLNSLAKVLVGPRNLIKKRLDKLLDFERLEEKLLEVGSVTYEEEAARHTYQALNSLLVAELPQFNQLVVQWLSQILRTFVALQRDLAEQVLQKAEGSIAQLPHHCVSEPAFRKLVEDAIGQTSKQLRSFQENFEKVLPPPTSQPLLPGSERQVQALLNKYGPGKLYQVTSNISGAGTLDLTLPRGQVVALLQNKDTKGHSSRWLVDTGGHRGYVPAGKLQLYHVIPSEELRGQAELRRGSHRLAPEPAPTPAPSVPAVTQVVAAYPFVARSTHEVSLQPGQPVTVLEAHDKKGNPEWSLVEVNGQRGYVPSGFLARAPSPSPWGWTLPS
nr:rho guanine nucleotide exchange factor 37 isoform X2 [Cavia porcellus]